VDNVVPGSLYFLIQGGLFNKLNEYVFQTWELVEFENGKSVCEKMVNLYEPSHTQEIVNFVAECFDNVSKGQRVDDLELKRIQKLSQTAIDWMRNQMKLAREARKNDLEKDLKAKLARIKAWEQERAQYLKGIIDGTKLANEVHGGAHAQIKKAQRELENLGALTKEYQEFILLSLMTNEEADIRILAVFMSSEKGIA
jgi:hypothetical protein